MSERVIWEGCQGGRMVRVVERIVVEDRPSRSCEWDIVRGETAQRVLAQALMEAMSKKE